MHKQALSQTFLPCALALPRHATNPSKGRAEEEPVLPVWDEDSVHKLDTPVRNPAAGRAYYR